MRNAAQTGAAIWLTCEQQLPLPLSAVTLEFALTGGARAAVTGWCQRAHAHPGEVPRFCVVLCGGPARNSLATLLALVYPSEPRSGMFM